jgi:hypothetical protein
LHLIYGYDFLDFGDPFPQDSFDTHLHCHLGARAALAGTLQANPDRIVIIGSDQFNIAAVALQSRPHGLDYLSDPILERFFTAGFAAAALFTHKKPPKNSIQALL